jgi:hypothetical protein
VYFQFLVSDRQRLLCSADRHIETRRGRDRTPGGPKAALDPVPIDRPLTANRQT